LVKVPGRGDIVILNFDPQAGHEQAGRRPALVLSPREYNEIVGLSLVVPITSRAKGYPFEVQLPGNLKTCGVVLADQVKNIDWRARNARVVERVPQPVMDETLAKIATLLS